MVVSQEDARVGDIHGISNLLVELEVGTRLLARTVLQGFLFAMISSGLLTSSRRPGFVPLAVAGMLDSSRLARQSASTQQVLDVDAELFEQLAVLV